MTTDKLSVQALVQICYQKGLRSVIFSPGSRNAPLIVGFSEHGGFNTLVIPDERVAAFHALGQGIATRIPSVICCTSGTAALNYAPAIAEAYYQGVPLLILTADRPVEWIDMGIGQSMRQKAIFSNYVKMSYQFVQEAHHKDDLWYNERLANAAINEAMAGVPGPVHINLPFRESLYTVTEELPLRHPIVQLSEPNQRLSDEVAIELEEIWKGTKRRLIIIGQGQKDDYQNELVQKLIDKGGVVVMTETTSNVHSQGLVNCIDRVLPLVGQNSEYEPDLVISLRGAVVSKRIKSFIKDARPQHHWFVGRGKPKDTYQRLSHHLKLESNVVLEYLSQLDVADKSYPQAWYHLNKKAKLLHDKFLTETKFCDLKVFETLLSFLSKNIVVHFASSTPIRYSQLFSELQTDQIIQCNRGVSGIDGSTSTALGYAGCSEKMNIIITGDISFFYDSNAFWYKNRPTNLKVVLINNGGGNIFKYIPGPESTAQLEVFEASHQLNASAIAELYDLAYTKISSLKELKNTLPQFYVEDNNQISLLEIDTLHCANSDTLRAYFTYLGEKSKS